MENKIVYSPKALEDLESIWDYIENELCNPAAAKRIVNGILDQVEILKKHPKIGTELIFDDAAASGYRMIRFENYTAFYRQSAANTIYVDRVLYKGQDYMQILFGGEP